MHPDPYNPMMAMAATLKSADELLDELTYRSYKYNRDRSPEISAKSWAHVFVDAEKYERRYQEEKAK